MHENLSGKNNRIKIPDSDISGWQNDLKKFGFTPIEIIEILKNANDNYSKEIRKNITQALLENLENLEEPTEEELEEIRKKILPPEEK